MLLQPFFSDSSAASSAGASSVQGSARISPTMRHYRKSHIVRRPLSLQRFPSFDRQADTAVALVEIGHHGINLSPIWKRSGRWSWRSRDKSERRIKAVTSPSLTILPSHHRSLRSLPCHRITAAQIGNALKRIAIKLFNAKLTRSFS